MNPLLLVLMSCRRPAKKGGQSNRKKNNEKIAHKIGLKDCTLSEFSWWQTETPILLLTIFLAPAGNIIFIFLSYSSPNFFKFSIARSQA
jgi:hypothetical protein